MAKPVSDWTRDDLEALIGSEETSNLEFKDGRSLAREPGKKADIAKDVSAMANAAGGLIVYGIHEKNSVADSIAGCPAEHGKAEWFEQVINNNIEPKVQGVTIKRIDLPDNKLALVVDVPKATTFAPHQNKTDGRYYRRYNTTSQMMLDHEVRDLMRRASSPELYLRFAILPTGHNPDLFQLHVFFGNLSQEPALYSQVELIFEDAATPFQIDHNWVISNLQIENVGRGKLYKRQFMVPTHMPIMTEREQAIFSNELILDQNMSYTLGYQISAPGFFKTELFKVVRYSDPRVHLEPTRLTKRPD